MRVFFKIAYLLIIISIFIITRQFPLNLYGFSGIPKFLVTIAILICIPYIIKEIKNRNLELIISPLIILLSIHLFYSLILNNNDPIAALRFYLITVLVVLSYFLIFPPKIVKWFILIVAIHAGFLIIFEIYMLFFVSLEEASVIRQFFLSNKLGDVYTYTNFFYRIQILGNPLIPIAFFVAVLMHSKNIIKIILFMGVVIASNLAFYFVTGLFLIGYYILKSRTNFSIINRAINLFVLLILALPFIISYMLYILPKKSYSLSVRIDQLHVLIDNMSTDWISTLFGRGLGNLITVQTPLRDYSVYGYYFELQTVFLLNQLGVLLFMIYVTSLAYVSYRSYNNPLVLWAYVCYILYAITNPYIFDTTHIITILILNAVQKQKFYSHG